jgi:macrolide transport system ATP-binding/permease protein
MEDSPERNMRLLLRLLLAMIDLGAWLAPPSRRRAWRRQWRADILHEWQWLSRSDASLLGRATLVRRAAGALRHAFWLRRHVRRLEMITHDLRYGWRQMLRRPGVTLAAVLTLGLGIGANVMMYSWLDGRLRRLVPGAIDPDRLVAMNGVWRARNTLNTSYQDFLDFRERRPSTIEDLIVYTLVPLNMRIGGDPMRVFGEVVSGNYFDVLGVRPALGRMFLRDEGTTPNRYPVVVFSYNFWQRRFAGDPSVVGRTVTLNARAFTVVGVAAEGFRGAEPYLNLDLWVPVVMQPSLTAGGDRLSVRGNHWLEAMVRLKPGVSIARAQADLNVVAADLGRAYPADSFPGVQLYELWRAPSMGGAAVTAVMGIQLGVAAIVLLIACANVANLLLASAATRQRETAVRLTLGASRGRLVQQLLTESTMLAGAGGLTGVVFAYWTKGLAKAFIPPAPLPIDFEPQLNGVVMLFGVAITIATAFVFGLVPALQGSQGSVVTALKEAASGATASPRRARLRHALVVAQVALSLLLLVSAGLFIRTLVNAQSVDPGFSMRNGLLASIDLQATGYDEVRGRAFQQQLAARVRDVPGVEAASVAQRIPLGFGSTSDMSVTVEGYTPAPNEEMHVYYNRVGPAYFATMGISIFEGREFSERDSDGARDVTVINETLARRYFPGRSAIGGRIHVGPRTVDIVGIARDGKYSSVSEPPRPFMYLSLQQWYRPDIVLIARTTGDPAAHVAAVQAAVHALDPNLPLFDVRTVAEHLEVSVFIQRMIATLLGGFGALALLLAVVGLYGVIAAIAVQRTTEIGMRMALGATRQDILALVLRQGWSMTMAGVAVGLSAAFAVTRLFRSLLVGVTATDAVSFIGTTLLLVVVALLACYVPARRAAALDPLQALRNE